MFHIKKYHLPENLKYGTRVDTPVPMEVGPGYFPELAMHSATLTYSSTATLTYSSPATLTDTFTSFIFIVTTRPAWVRPEGITIAAKPVGDRWGKITTSRGSS